MSVARTMAKRLLRGKQQKTTALGPFNDHIPDGAPTPAPRPASLEPRDPKWLESAREMRELVREHAAESESLRRLADPVARDLLDRGFPRLMVPKEFGGHQVDLVTAMEVVEELAYQDGSLGWNTWVSTGHGRLADCMTVEAASAVFSSGSTIAGNVNPTGRARRVEGGFRLTGRWGFASACQLADWLLCGGVVEGAPEGSLTAFVVPVADAKIHDAWYTTGLRATGSEDFEVDDVFVPEAFTFDQEALWSVEPRRETVAYARPYSEYSPVLMAAVAVGVARHAIEAFTTTIAQKSRQGDDRWNDVSPVVLDRIGRAEANIQASRSWLYEVGATLAALRPGDPSQGLASRFASAHIAEAMSEAVRLLYDVGGGSGIYARSEVERCFRDVQMVSHHALIGFPTFADAGRSLLDQTR